jgi:hypothetical protein
MASPLYGRRPKRKPKADRTCMVQGCGARIASWKWLCDNCFSLLPYSRKHAICEARAAREPQRIFGLSRDAAAFVVEQRERIERT